ncbi:hypothetical protein AWJ20_1991 [Sugiyamaella lignohabitans]|uniref:F-box domain-containing protein n=1 Tax=Sugiyamaella lignohabitans TaxID=796027 RepID=A0A167ES46_9ASCO|nr:uncharacterized protein AWJ20_1991 [Sugiyamaella lignohabitans]ANB14403.1 hypothetical protein AWJ20_1991 [Sugiyamaella lignohabitans]
MNLKGSENIQIKGTRAISREVMPKMSPFDATSEADSGRKGLRNSSSPQLPDELWVAVFEFLDIPDLYNCSKVDHRFRRLAQDPQLHHRRLTQTAKWLERAYPLRPSCKDLYDRNILLSRVQLAPSPCQKHILASTRLARIFVKDSLRRGLSRRPTRKELIDRGVMKHGGSIFADKIGSLERQRVVDIIRGFFSDSQRPSLEAAIRRGVVSPPDQENKPVRVLTRIFSYCFRESSESPRSSHATRMLIDPPTRANVHRMTEWFEELARNERSSFRFGTQPSQTSSSFGPYAFSTVATTLSSPSPVHQISGISYDGVSAIRQRFLAIS